MTDTPREARIAALKQAAATKRAQAVTRAETGIRKLVKDRQAITFRSVARAAGVSLDFLYTHPDLRQRIEILRDQQQNTAPDNRDRTSGESTIIQALTQALRTERTDNRTRIRELEQRLAASHGENLLLRRRLRELGAGTT